MEVSNERPNPGPPQEDVLKEGPSLGDIQELLKKVLPGDKVRVTHSLWPRNPGNGIG